MPISATAEIGALLEFKVQLSCRHAMNGFFRATLTPDRRLATVQS
jgi:hypothetical protein